MIERKNIWDVVESSEIDSKVEIKNIWSLYGKSSELFMSDDTSDWYGYSFLDFIEENFLKFRHKGTHVTFRSFLSACGFKITYSDSIESNTLNLDSVDVLTLFMEITKFVVVESINITPIKHNEDEEEDSDVRELILNVMDILLERTHQKFVEIAKDKYVIVPDDEAVTAVAELILPNDEQLALSVLGYSHYSNKDNIAAKRTILQRLANYTESHAIKDKDVGYVLNNFHIRHGNVDNLKNASDLSNQELNDLYDDLYREILYQLLQMEHTKFGQRVQQLKQNQIS